MTAGEAEEPAIRQGAWAVIVQDERQQKMGQLRPEIAAPGLDCGSAGGIELALLQKHKSNSRRSITDKEMQIG